MIEGLQSKNPCSRCAMRLGGSWFKTKDTKEICSILTLTDLYWHSLTHNYWHPKTKFAKWIMHKRSETYKPSCYEGLRSNLNFKFCYTSFDYNLLFIYDFAFDLCHDFSFWKAETGRCIPKKMDDDGYLYTFPPLCNRTELNCLHGYFKRYCPNKDESCDGNDGFFCNRSKTCVAKGRLIWHI